MDLGVKFMGHIMSHLHAVAIFPQLAAVSGVPHLLLVPPPLSFSNENQLINSLINILF